MTGSAGRYWAARSVQRDADALASGDPPNPRRITQALDAAGLYGPEVDAACGGQEPMVEEWEAGSRLPTPAQLQQLADLTGVTVGFFYLPDPPPLRGFICQRSGPGRGCSPSTPRRPAAPVTQLHPDTLF